MRLIAIFARTGILACADLAMGRAAPVKLIFGSDTGPDCDDAGTAALLHALADKQEVELLAMMSATSFEWGAGALDAYNTYYGRPDVPVGALKDTGFLARSNYSKYIAENYPNDLKSAENAPNATMLYRQILAGQAHSNLVRKIHNRDMGRISDDLVVHVKVSTLLTTAPLGRAGWTGNASPSRAAFEKNQSFNMK